MTKLLYIFLVLLLIACKYNNNTPKDEIEIIWTQNLPGDFSFIHSWIYPEAISQNDFGQLVCDGLCPEESYSMIKEDGSIYPDSVEEYYKLIDTTHLNFSIQSEASAYEWAETHFFTIKKVSKNKEVYEGYSQMSIATHSTLHFKIIDNKCYPEIVLNSVSQSGIKKFPCIGGLFKIDQDLWKKGIMKAVFDFTFEDKTNPKQPMYWKGKIYAKIEDNNK